MKRERSKRLIEDWDVDVAKVVKEWVSIKVDVAKSVEEWSKIKVKKLRIV